LINLEAKASRLNQKNLRYLLNLREQKYSHEFTDEDEYEFLPQKRQKYFLKALC